MTVYLEDFGEIVSRMEEDNKNSDKYMDALREVDSSLCDFIFENKYTNILYFQNQFAMQKLLGEELYDWISWYFYDRSFIEDDKPNAWVDEVGYVINDYLSFMEFAQHGLKLPMRPKHENKETA